MVFPMTVEPHPESSNTAESLSPTFPGKIDENVDFIGTDLLNIALAPVVLINLNQLDVWQDGTDIHPAQSIRLVAEHLCIQFFIQPDERICPMIPFLPGKQQYPKLCGAG